MATKIPLLALGIEAQVLFQYIDVIVGPSMLVSHYLDSVSDLDLRCLTAQMSSHNHGDRLTLMNMSSTRTRVLEVVNKETNIRNLDIAFYKIW